MNAHDRAKMMERLVRALPFLMDNAVRVHNTARFVVLEVDRAVRAERKKCREADESLLSALHQADARIVDGMKKVWRKRI